MGNLVFVHGIGVRAPTEGGEHPLDATCRAIRWELLFRKIEWRVVKCDWGDKLGARLLADGKSLPKSPGRLGIAIRPEDPAGLWSVLIDDPTFELRALATMPSREIKVAPGGPPSATGGLPDGPAGGRPAWVDLQRRLTAGIKPSIVLEERLKRFDLEASFAQAVREVQADHASQAVLRHPEAARAIARSITARTLRLALERGVPAPGLADLEAIVGETEGLLRKGQLAGVSDWAKSVLLGWGTSWGERRRATLFADATPIAGDVIIYQAHGDRIRQRIIDVVEKAPEPVAVLAHSLGGVATTEALCESPALRRRVKKFVTAGSQAGFFYEVDGLRTLPFGKPLPDDFPDWLNFWDPRDFLSFLIKPVFVGGRFREDIQIDSGVPFPASHSAYWRQAITWDNVKDFLAG